MDDNCIKHKWAMPGTNTHNLSGIITGTTTNGTAYIPISRQSTTSDETYTAFYEDKKQIKLDFSEVKTLEEVLIAIKTISELLNQSNYVVTHNILNDLPEECKKYIQVLYESPMDALKNDFVPAV